MDSLLQTPISGTEIKKHGAKITDYAQIYKSSDILQIVNEFFPITALLYLTRENYGHWTLLLYKKGKTPQDSTIEFFDPYGIFIDDQLKFESIYEFHPRILYLLSKFPGKVEYNNYEFQGPDTKTCGRHVISRIKYKDLNIDEYKKKLDTFINKLKKMGINIDYDILVSLIAL